MVIEENFIKARVVLKISSLSTISFSPRLDFLGFFFFVIITSHLLMVFALFPPGLFHRSDHQR